MSLPEESKLIKGRGTARGVFSDLLISGLILGSVSLAFALGRLSVSLAVKPDVTIENRAFGAGVLTEKGGVATSIAEPAMITEGSYVGSKNGTKYHLPWCPGAQQIAEQNKVWFQNKEEAEARGYTPAANCKGI